MCLGHALLTTDKLGRKWLVAFPDRPPLPFADVKEISTRFHAAKTNKQWKRLLKWLGKTFGEFHLEAAPPMPLIE